MQLRMNVHTAWNGQAYRPGDVIEVEDSGTIRRWLSNGICSRLAALEPAVEGQTSEEPEVVDLHTFTKARLAEYAAARNIELPPGGTKADWLALLTTEPTSTEGETAKGEGTEGESTGEAAKTEDQGEGEGATGESSDSKSENNDGAAPTEGETAKGEE